jgi:AraC-like DNA-binding protein
MRYLTRWRIQLACRMLCDDEAKVSAIALDVGYRSEAAFSRAFKSMLGTSPASWRRRRQAGDSRENRVQKARSSA